MKVARLEHEVQVLVRARGCRSMQSTTAFLIEMLYSGTRAFRLRGLSRRIERRRHFVTNGKLMANRSRNPSRAHRTPLNATERHRTPENAAERHGDHAARLW